MATELLYPSAIGDSDTWILDAGADKVTAVQTNDGDTSCIRRGGLIVLTQTFEVDASSLKSWDTINSITVHTWTKNNTSTGPRITLELSLPGAHYTGTPSTNVTQTSYLEYTALFSTNPDTSSAWVLDDIDGTLKFQVGIRNASTGYIFRCTQLWIAVDYTEGTGGAPPLVDGGLVNAGLIGGRLIG